MMYMINGRCEVCMWYRYMITVVHNVPVMSMVNETRNPKVIWEEPHCHPWRQRVLLAVQFPLQTSSITQLPVCYIYTPMPHSPCMLHCAVQFPPKFALPIGIPTPLERNHSCATWSTTINGISIVSAVIPQYTGQTDRLTDGNHHSICTNTYVDALATCGIECIKLMAVVRSLVSDNFSDMDTNHTVQKLVAYGYDRWKRSWASLAWLCAHVVVVTLTGSSMNLTCSPSTRSDICCALNCFWFYFHIFIFINL